MRRLSFKRPGLMLRMNERPALRRFHCLRPVSQQAQPQIQPQIQYPQVHAKPINEFTEDGYVVKAFPGLFPSGRADLVYTYIKVTAVDYFRHLVRYV